MSSADLPRATRAMHEFLLAVGAPVHGDAELAQTAERVARAFDEELLVGYRASPSQILADTTQATADGLVVMTNLATSILCPHHLMPATGVVHLAYLPTDRIVGFGALAQLVECFARRLILQEEFVRSITEALHQHLAARGAACVANLAPTCLTSRGPCQRQARVITRYDCGEMRTDVALRAEFSSLLATTSSCL